MVTDTEDEWDILELLLDSNRQRVKTNEQVAREAQLLLKIESEKARRRQATGKAGRRGGKCLPAKSPEGVGDARDVVAEKLGIGAKKIEQAVAVVTAIDHLRNAGKNDEVKVLQETLNGQSVNRAHKAAKAAGFLDASGAEESKDTRFVLLSSWNDMVVEEKKQILLPENEGFTFNRQVSDGIEWSQWSWNPITDCLHNCDYCWARDVAQRFFKQGFKTSFYPRRLYAPENTKVPTGAASNVALKNVFTVSIGDLFGKWVPVE